MLKKINWQYTIGEIIIVIIGISIAFALNNWANSQANKKTKELYLKNLSRDIELDQQKLKDNIAKINANLEGINLLLPHLGNPGLDGRDTIIPYFFRLAEPIEFHPKDVTYLSLINSGDFKIIRDIDLKLEVENYYGYYKKVQYDYQRMEGFSVNYLADFFMKNIDYNKIRSGEADFLDVPYTRNMIMSLKGILLLKRNSSQEAVNKATELLDRLNSQK